LQDIEYFRSERNLKKRYYYSANIQNKNKNSMKLLRVVSNGQIKQNKIIQVYCEKSQMFHSATVRFNRTYIASGVSVRYRIRNWGNIQYVAIGTNIDGKFHHVKITNPVKEQWQVVSFSFKDISYLIQNDFASKDVLEVSDLSIKLKSDSPADNSIIEILEIEFWEEESADDWLNLPHHERFRWKLMERVHSYQTSSIKNYISSCEKFFDEGSCPIVKNLDWPDHSKKPPDLHAVNTYRYSWHALHHVASLVLYSKVKDLEVAVDLAKQFSLNWIEQSWKNPDDDVKFSWYDHGTAERQLSLLMIYHELANREEKNEDNLNDLKKLILLQGRLLESEIFYARNQVDRYHNHAMFQDVALIVTALAFGNISCSGRWLKVGVKRLEEQISELIIRERQFSVFVENSIGYHSGVIRLLKFSSEIISLFDKKSPIHAVYTGMEEFSKLLTYPDGRSPAQGDTQRLPNSATPNSFIRSTPSQVTILENSGYSVVKGTDEKEFMFVMFATALSKTHKHQDNLSFTLFFDSQEWLIDPSHYSHEYEESITKFLRSPNAHNMISLQNVPHSIEPGLTNLFGSIDDGEFVIKGENHAFLDYIVTRKIEGEIGKLNFKITDYVSQKGITEPDARLILHFGEHIEVNQQKQNLILSCASSNYKLRIKMPSSDLSFHRGNTESTIKGISGLGFMTHSETTVVQCGVPINEEIIWKIEKI